MPSPSLWLEVADTDGTTADSDCAQEPVDAAGPAGELLVTERGRSVARRGLARLALEQGDTENAEKHVNAAFEIAAVYDDPPMKADIMVSMGELDEHRGLRGLAIERLERAIMTYEGFGFRDRAGETRETVERLKNELEKELKKRRKPTLTARQ